MTEEQWSIWWERHESAQLMDKHSFRSWYLEGNGPKYMPGEIETAYGLYLSYRTARMLEQLLKRLGGEPLCA